MKSIDALLRARFVEPPAADERLRALVASLTEFEGGRVPPGPTAVEVDGLAVEQAFVDRALMAACPRSTLRGWPGGAEAAVVVTHDVDAFDGLSWFGLRAAGWGVDITRSALRGDLARAGRTARRALAWGGWWLRGVDPVADFDRWMALESRYGVRSTFFFLALSRALSREGRLYRVDDPQVVRVMRTLHRGGWEVGLHAARYGSDDAAGLAAQRARLEAALGQPVQAVRYHYLSARFPDAWRQMARAGFSISSNVGFHPPWQGFRTGTAWPHRPVGDDGPWEVPMALMDAARGPAATLLVPVFERLLAEARAVGGVVVLNFHTNYRAEVDAPGVHRAFEAILERVRIAREAGEVASMTLGEVVDHVAAAAASGEAATDG